MGLSTVELWNREIDARQDLEQSGETDVHKARIRDRIQLVVDSASGHRTFRNLWGLKPVRKQELFHWIGDDGLFPSRSYVGGKGLGINSLLGGVGEGLAEEVMDEFGERDQVSVTEEGHTKPTIISTDIYRSQKGIEFHRIAYRENRRIHVSDPEAWIPGIPATFDISWFAVFPK